MKKVNEHEALSAFRSRNRQKHLLDKIRYIIRRKYLQLSKEITQSTHTKSSAVSYTRTRNPYTAEDVQLVNETLKSFIKSKKPISKSDLTDFINNSVELKPLLQQKGLKSLLIKVRTERIRYENSIN